MIDNNSRFQFIAQDRQQWGGRGFITPHTHFFWKKKGRVSKQKLTMKRLSRRSKCYCFSHSRASRIQFSLSANRWTTILFSIPWSLHFQIHIAGPVAYHYNHWAKTPQIICKKRVRSKGGKTAGRTGILRTQDKPHNAVHWNYSQTKDSNFSWSDNFNR